jgi:hypothetical protein
MTVNTDRSKTYWFVQEIVSPGELRVMEPRLFACEEDAQTYMDSHDVGAATMFPLWLEVCSHRKRHLRGRLRGWRMGRAWDRDAPARAERSRALTRQANHPRLKPRTSGLRFE